MVKYNKHTHEVLSIAMTKEAMKELRWLARKLGISQRAVIEMAIREKAEREANRPKITFTVDGRNDDEVQK